MRSLWCRTACADTLRAGQGPEPAGSARPAPGTDHRLRLGSRMNTLPLILESHRRMYQFQAIDCPLGPTTAVRFITTVATAAVARGLVSRRSESSAPRAAHLEIARL